MAAGKTTFGRPLAAALNRPFVDLDHAVEADAGISVAEIFRLHGEEAFRGMELRALRKAAAGGAVVACGGGTPCRGENMDFMLGCGTVVELKASTETTLRRLRLAPGQRPLVDTLLDRPDELAEKVKAMQAEREPFYSRAHIVFGSDYLETEDEIRNTVNSFLEQYIPKSSYKPL